MLGAFPAQPAGPGDQKILPSLISSSPGLPLHSYMWLSSLPSSALHLNLAKAGVARSPWVATDVTTKIPDQNSRIWIHSAIWGLQIQCSCHNSRSPCDTGPWAHCPLTHYLTSLPLSPGDPMAFLWFGVCLCGGGNSSLGTLPPVNGEGAPGAKFFFK